MNQLVKFVCVVLIVVSPMLLANGDCKIAKTVRYPIPLRVDLDQTILSPMLLEFKEVLYEKPIAELKLSTTTSTESTFIGYMQAKQQQRWQQLLPWPLHAAFVVFCVVYGVLRQTQFW